MILKNIIVTKEEPSKENGWLNPETKELKFYYNGNWQTVAIKEPETKE